jgi:RimJ/RimL family protein N-acetyltransferase
MKFYHAYAQSMTDTERRTRARKDFFDHFADGAARFGYICWAIIAKPEKKIGETPSTAEEPGAFLGWAGVLTPALEDTTLGPELAYMIASPFHGHGLITEAAYAVVVDAFQRYGLASLHAVVDIPNVASRRVAEKLGFRYRGPVRVYGSEEMVLYSLIKDSP